MPEITRLPQERWREYRELRLAALKTDPEAFSSSYEEEAKFSVGKWKERMKGVVFALAEGEPIGMVGYAFKDKAKTSHIAHVYSVYVAPEHRGKGVGGALLKAAIAGIREHVAESSKCSSA